MSFPTFCHASQPSRRHSRGLTLVETLVSLAVLVVTGVGAVSGFMLLNRYASDNRDQSTARELCQERIEQVMTMPFSPRLGNYPAVVGQDGNTYNLLGTATDYSATYAYIGAGGQQTSSTYNTPGEPVTIYRQPTGTKLITGNRTTTIWSAGSNNLVRIAVTVTYTLRGQSKNYTLYTLRGPDS